MGRHWTFGQKVGGSFVLLIILTITMGLVARTALRNVIVSKDRVIDVEARMLIDAQELLALLESKRSAGRGFLLTGDDRFLRDMQDARAGFASVLDRLRGNAPTDEGRRLLDSIERAETGHQTALEEVIALKRTERPIDEVARAFDDRVGPTRAELDTLVRSFVAREERFMREGEQASTDDANRSVRLVGVLALMVAVAGFVLGVALTRALRRQIGTAVSQVQSSSTELQAAATQQATSAKQQATAMTEIATTIGELLASSRQITESARRVAQIADETASGANSGGETVERGRQSVAAIRRQVDLIVGHMLELGRKSQQIGTVVEIVSELADQTNILAINATIEAAGAGEAGRRFGVVADEIRKLADRVSNSAGEIRRLIEDVRGAVNTTVMATETGSKAVDSGAQQFALVTDSFKRIAGLVTTTTEAAREIELSIKQQMTAIEQVNVAVTNIAQASRETEASTGQTQQTASQLAFLSRDLMRVIRPEAAA